MDNDKNAAPQPPSGLGSPLVTVANAGGSGIRPPFSAGNIGAPQRTHDHPLASPPPPAVVTTPPPVIVQQQQQQALRQAKNTRITTTTTIDGTTGATTTTTTTTTAPASSLGDIYVRAASSGVSNIDPPLTTTTVNETPRTTTPPPPVQQGRRRSQPAATLTPPRNNNTSNAPTKTTGSIPPSSPVNKSLDALADSFLTGPTVDNIDTMQLNHQHQHSKSRLKPPPLPPNESGLQRLKTLAERRAWGDVLQVAGDLLRNPSQQYPHAPIYASLIVHDDDNDTTTTAANDDKIKLETVEILTLECHAWIKLRRYGDLGREVERWSFSKVNDASATSPEWVGWGLHILAAESLQYTDPTNPLRCTNELYRLRQAIAQKQEDRKWILRVDSALSNAFSRRRDWRMALDSLDHMMELLPQIYDNDDALLGGYRVEVLTRQGRIMLQMGALPEAKILFDEAQTVAATTERRRDSWVVERVPAQIAMNHGLWAFADRNYDQSMTDFSTCIRHLRAVSKDSRVLFQRRVYMDPLWVESWGSIMTAVWNNVALSALYSCRMKEAVIMMESVVRENPTAFLTERLAFNLCTLYELGSDTASSSRKKRVLQLVAKRFFLHDIGPEAFRVAFWLACVCIAVGGNDQRAAFQFQASLRGGKQFPTLPQSRRNC